MRKYIPIILLALIVVFVAISCSSPYSVPKPASIPEPGSPMPPPLIKKMCVGHDCRKLGASDVTGTTRGHTDDSED